MFCLLCSIGSPTPLWQALLTHADSREETEGEARSRRLLCSRATEALRNVIFKTLLWSIDIHVNITFCTFRTCLCSNWCINKCKTLYEAVQSSVPVHSYVHQNTLEFGVQGAAVPHIQRRCNWFALLCSPRIQTTIFHSHPRARAKSFSTRILNINIEREARARAREEKGRGASRAAGRQK